MSSQVNILLATYNGMRYLGDQLQSLESQSQPITRITIRDDGSSDGTQSYLTAWAKEKPNVHLLQGGPRLGVTDNFFTLLKNASHGCAYFAFCDQDDVWLPGKIERAVSVLQTYSQREPLLYCSRVEYVGEKLQHLGYSRIPKCISFGNALVENIVTGCTVVLNSAARELICDRLPVQNVLVHDWWMYLVISALGRIIFDETPFIKYRQHNSNQEGGTPSALHILRLRIVRFFLSRSKRRLLSAQALEFARLFATLLDAKNRDTLERFLSVRQGLWTRAAYTTSMDIRRQTWIDTVFLRTMIVLGRV